MIQFDSMIPTSDKKLAVDVQAIIADRGKYKSVLEVGEEEASPHRKKVGLSDLNMARPSRRGLTLEEYNQGKVEEMRESHVIADRWTPLEDTWNPIRVHSRKNTGIRFDVKNQDADPNLQPDPYHGNLVQGIPKSSGKPMVGLSTMNGPTCSI